jgi:TRAP-type C4-dicarboxylate transport system substrate-binding protein
VADNQEALQALLDSGLELVEPDAAEAAQWREIVNRSHQELAADGLFDASLLERMQALIGEFRSRAAARP